MKIARFLDPSGRVRHGAPVDASTARVLEDEHQLTEATERMEKVLAPLEPRAIFCIGLNYRQHAEETGAKLPEHPVLFMKGVNAVQNPGDPIVLPRVEPEQVDYECELAVVIGREARDVPRDRALEYVLGYTCANDVSGRRWQIELGGGQWNRGKSFDTFCPLGPWIVTPDEIPDPNALRISTRIGGETLQDSNTSDMIFDVRALIEFLSQGTTLLPGTVILTGTPPGVGFARKPPRFLRDGDEVTVEIERVGILANPVQSEG